MAANAGTLFVDIKPNLSGFEREMNSSMSRVGKRVTSLGGTISRTITGPLLLAATAAGGWGLKTASDLQQAEISFLALTGSAEETEKVMTDLTDLAKNSPFTLTGVMDVGKQLMNAGTSGEDLITVLTGIGDAASMAGGGTETLSRVTRQYNQIMLKGRVTQEDLMVLAEAGIPIYDELAAQLGVTGEELAGMIKDGDVGADVLTNAFVHPVGAMKKSAGQMEAQSHTIMGIWSTFTDTLATNLAAAFTPEVLDSIGGALERLGESLGPAIAAAAPAFTDLIDAMIPLVGVISDILVWFSKLSPEMQKVVVFAGVGVAALGPLISVFGRFITVFGGIFRLAKGVILFGRIAWAIARVYGVVGMLAKVGRAVMMFARVFVIGLRMIAMAFLTNPVALLITAIVVAIAAAAYLIYRNWDTIKKAFAAAWEFIKPILVMIWEKIKSVFTAIWGFLKSAWNMIYGVIKAAVTVIWNIIKVVVTIWTLPIRIWWRIVSGLLILAWRAMVAIFNAIVAVVKPIWDALWNGIKTVVSVVWGWLSGILSSIWSVITTVFNKIKTAVSNVWNTLWTGIKKTVNTVVTFVKTKFNAVKTTIIDVFNKVKTKVTSIWDSIKGMISRAVDSIGNIVDGIWSGLKGVLNVGIDLINGIIGGVNILIRGINLLPGADLAEVPKIPRLAEGGIVQRPTLALIGEAGPEAVVPLGKMQASLPEPKDTFIQVFIGDDDITRLIERTVREDSANLARKLVGGRRL